MTRETSIYLDMIRFLAALVVCLGHLSGQRMTGGFLWQLGAFMPAAVTVFFVLSGFVIGHVTQRRERSAKDYALARAARIASVALPALVLTFLLDALGRGIQPDLYAASWGYVAEGRIWQFLGGALFVHQLWFANLQQGSMLPYWSLGFEVWYYVIFGLALFAPVKWRAVAVVVAIVVVGPRIALMFPLWLLGVLCSRLMQRLPQRESLGWLLFVGSFAVAIGYVAWAALHGRLLGYAPESFRRPELLEDYLVAGLFVANLLGFSLVARRFRVPLSLVERPVRWLAGATFTLYLLHMPIAQFICTLMPWPPNAAATRILVLGGTFAAVLLAAELTERRKAAWRRGIEALFDRLQPGRARAASRSHDAIGLK